MVRELLTGFPDLLDPSYEVVDVVKELCDDEVGTSVHRLLQKVNLRVLVVQPLRVPIGVR